MFDEYKGIPSQAKLLVYLSFLPGLVVGFIYTDLSYFLTKVQGFSDFWMGATIFAMGGTLVATSIPLGILADRYGKRSMLFLGNVLAGASLIGFALTTNVLLVVMIAALEGLGEAAFAVSFNALLADSAGDAKRTPAFSLGAFLGWISGAIGAFAISSVLLIERLGVSAAQAHTILYVIVGLLGLSVSPLVLRVHETKTVRRKNLLPRDPRTVKTLTRYATYSVAIALGAGLFVPLMTRWFSAAYNVSDAVSGPVLAASSLLTAGAVLLVPRLARRLGLVKAIVVSQAFSTVFMVAVPWSPTFAVAGLIYTIRVVLMNLSNPLGQSLLMGLVPREDRAAASGITASLWRLPNSFSSVIGATLIGAGFLALPFYIATILYVFSITAFWFLFKDARLPEEAVLPAQVLTQSSSLDGSEEIR
ncbi:MAG: MFS transporter [Nitrososphaerales archaeon]